MARRRSRLARKENQRMMRQSVLFFVLAGVILVVVVFFGIPLLTRFASILGDVKTSTLPIESDDNIAPFAPQLEIPYEATPSAKINISGFAEANSTVVLLNSGAEISETSVDEDGEFEFPSVRLDVGENDFSARAIDSAGNESQKSRISTVVFDNQPPKLEISSPNDGNSYDNLENDSLTVEGVTEFGVSLYISSRLAQVNAEGEFSHRVRLNEGENVINLVAIDRAGNTNGEEIKVNYSK